MYIFDLHYKERNEKVRERNRLTAKHRKQDKVGECNETMIEGKTKKEEQKKKKKKAWSVGGMEKLRQKERAKIKGMLSQCEKQLENKER